MSISQESTQLAELVKWQDWTRVLSFLQKIISETDDSQRVKHFLKKNFFLLSYSGCLKIFTFFKIAQKENSLTYSEFKKSPANSMNGMTIGVTKVIATGTLGDPTDMQ